MSTPASQSTSISQALDALQGDLVGNVVRPNDAAYGDARSVWNGMIDRRPAAIVRAASTADIAPTIRLAQDLGLPLAVRGGGHNVAGNGTVDDGIVLDLGSLNTVEVDPATREVRVGPGATLADVDQATEPHGLAVPSGVVSGTGMAGLTLGGGVGWLTRAHGLSVDNLLSADVVTAAGELVHASPTENGELFWGLRGGGGNFGVVSGFSFRAHPLGPDVLAGTFVFDAPQWTEALRAYAAWTAELPDAMTSIISFVVPPADWDLGDELLMLVGFAWASPDRAEGERWIDRLRAATRPSAEVLDPTTWTAWQSAADGLFPKGARAYWKNTSFDNLDDSTIATLVDHARELTWRGTAFDVHHMGGAFGRVPEEDTPFPNRSARYWLNIYGFWSDPADDARRTAWVRQFAADMEPHASGGLYLNFLGQEREPVEASSSALAVYGRPKLDRLVALKRQYDPDNVFRLNHNIPPG
ncbi:MAG: FAD-binding oxidoreductase [Chloroflexota bacterium]